MSFDLSQGDSSRSGTSRGRDSIAVCLLPIGNATSRRKSIAPCLPRVSAVRFRGAASFSGTASATAACHEIADLDARHHLERSASNACDPRIRFRPPGHDRAAEYQAVLAFTPTNGLDSSAGSFSGIWSDFLPERNYASEWRRLF